VTELPDDLQPDDEQAEDAAEIDDDEDDPGLSAEESLGLLPPD
jgi:hypothetical protein